jgi:hypothetical protein
VVGLARGFGGGEFGGLDDHNGSLEYNDKSEKRIPFGNDKQTNQKPRPLWVAAQWKWRML